MRFTALLIALLAQASQPTFKSGVNLVEVDVVVTDKAGQPVRGLTARRLRGARGRQECRHRGVHGHRSAGGAGRRESGIARSLGRVDGFQRSGGGRPRPAHRDGRLPRQLRRRPHGGLEGDRATAGRADGTVRPGGGGCDERPQDCAGGVHVGEGPAGRRDRPVLSRSRRSARRGGAAQAVARDGLVAISASSTRSRPGGRWTRSATRRSHSR